MDLTQSKLNKSEWNNIEVMVPDGEKRILMLIKEGYTNVNLRKNYNLAMIDFMKIKYTPEIEYELYKQYFEKEITSVVKMDLPKMAKKPLKTADVIRIKNMENNIMNHKDTIFEFLQISFCKNIMKNVDSAFYLYTLIQLKKSSIPNINKFVTMFVDHVIANTTMTIAHIFSKSFEFIEKNPHLLKYEDLSLFSHQKQLFTIAKTRPHIPKLILYIAPTGTGKTLSPLGLSDNNRIIFICVARHVGLALAKSAISVGKKIAFAFGCDTASDIRLHNSAACAFKVNKRSGGIGKVDNSIGTKVEIMICDVKSYITAMHYMLAFNKETDIIAYWDEPTITMDYETHPLHETIHKNWTENQISKLVLSCATLPKENEIMATITSFREKFNFAEIHTISSYDCKKTISIVNQSGKCSLPHLLFADYAELMESVTHCEENKTLLRYFDLTEIIRFIEHVQPNVEHKINDYFGAITDITMNSIKLYYLKMLREIKDVDWVEIYTHLTTTLPNKFYETRIPKSKYEKIVPPGTGVLITTKDAHTLTDGPTIFLAEDVIKVGLFYIQQSNIPTTVFQSVMDKIERNSQIQEVMDKLEKTIEDKEDLKEKTKEKDVDNNPEIRLLMQQLNSLRSEIKMVSLDTTYVPNMKAHQRIWAPDGNLVGNAFATTIDEENIRSIMGLAVSNDIKLLALMGVGVFEQKPNVAYMEIIKKLAYDQQLFIIIAASDYIYGTNYQFCHGFIGKDLTNMTQQKTIQAMGRIGRNNVQQSYTIRFRDDAVIARLFKSTHDNLEAINMSQLFS